MAVTDPSPSTIIKNQMTLTATSDSVSLAALTSLFIRTIEDADNLPLGLFQSLPSLQSLEIRDCPRLKALPLVAIQSLPSLQSLVISNCPQFGTELQLPQLPSLERISLVNLGNLEHIELSEGGRMPRSNFFPSLEGIMLWHLPRFKGWEWERRGNRIEEDDGDSPSLLVQDFSHPTCTSTRRRKRLGTTELDPPPLNASKGRKGGVEHGSSQTDISKKLARLSTYDISMTNWNLGFHLYMDMLPQYIHMHAAESVFAGKAVRVLRDRSPSFWFQDSISHLQMPQGSQKVQGCMGRFLFRNEPLVDLKLTGDDLLPQSEASKIEAMLRDLKLVVVGADLNGQLKAPKDCFLLAKGDFFQCFLEESRQLMLLAPRRSTPEAEIMVPFQLVDVIESQWNVLQGRIHDSYDFTELVRFHQEYLSALISESFLDIGSVSRILGSIMKLCPQFYWNIENLEASRIHLNWSTYVSYRGNCKRSQCC
ncbi:hypothetical protein CRG98_009023 [Punica granatum]|uniref:Gamma-tubulin complex component n=1 Tax=Punica granatum TaxID=22663 RepID=A0A2I0KPU3_PUNGR|nr:hypothetical protein CRG98_009023 [Punica granatum]